jgi:hypothetical protein
MTTDMADRRHRALVAGLGIRIFGNFVIRRRSQEPTNTNRAGSVGRQPLHRTAPNHSNPHTRRSESRFAAMDWIDVGMLF